MKSVLADIIFTGLLFRETNILNSMLCSAESWYGISKKHIEDLESIDLHFMHTIFNGHSKTAKEAFYLETGSIPIKFVLISRRLNFWRHIVNTDEYTLLHKFYKIQKACPAKNDWVNQIENDKNEINMTLSDEDVMNISKSKFKKLVKQKIKLAALEYLNSVAKDHSKSEKLMKTELQWSTYLKDKRFSVPEAQLLFKLRSRMVSVKANFKKSHINDLWCQLCKVELCDQKHLLFCIVLKKFIPEMEKTSVHYSDIFGNVDKQLCAVKLFTKILNQREIILEALPK